MPDNVAASMTASIILDKSDLLAQILKGLSEGQKELQNNKLEMYFDFSNSKNQAEFEKVIQKYRKQLSSQEFVVQIKDQGIDETVKSLDKLLEVVRSLASGKAFGTGSGNGKGIGNSIVDEKQLKTVIKLFEKMESHLGSMRKVISDVGDGNEFSPLLTMINKVDSSISELAKKTSSLSLNMNLDFDSDDKMTAEVQSRTAKLLHAYENLFNRLKMSGTLDSNMQGYFDNFDINQYDNMNAKIAAYKNFITEMREMSKQQFGKDYLYSDIEKSYYSAVSGAQRSLNNVIKSESTSNNSIENLFGKTDLSEVISQLTIIVNKLDEISASANNFTNIFKNGLDVNTSIQEVIDLTNRVKELETELAKIKNATPATVSTEQKKDAFPSTEATASVEKVADGFKEVKQETEKATESAKDYVRTISQVGEWNVDSKVSVVKEKNDGQLETWSYDAKRGKKDITYDKDGNINYGDPIITTISNYKQLEQTIVKADDKLRDLKKTLKDTKEINPNASTKNIEKQIQYQEKYISLLEQTVKMISQGDEYFLNEQQIIDARKRAATEYDLKQGTKSDISNAKQDAKTNKRDAKQAQIEAENIKLAEQKSIYNELNDSLDRYLTVSKRIESGKALEGDYEEVVKLQVEIEKLQNNPILSQEQLDASQRKLDKIETTLEDIATAKAKSDSVKMDSENVKNIQAEWDKNLKAIKDYMDAVTKLNNLKAKDKGTGSQANQIELQTKNVEELKQTAFEARQTLSSMYTENPDIITWKQWLDMMDLFKQASQGSAESVAKLKDTLNNLKTPTEKTPSLNKYENNFDSYQSKFNKYYSTLKKLQDGGWASDAYVKNINAVSKALDAYKAKLDELKNGDAVVTQKDIDSLNELEATLKNTISTTQSMSASEKGYTFVSGQKELDKIHQILKENSRMSTEAKNKIKAYYREIESGNPSASIDKIHGEIMKIVNAEVEAGRAGKNMWDSIKEKAWYGLAGAIGTYFGFNDIIRYGGQVVSIVTDLNTQITELAKVSEQSSKQIYADFDSYANIAKEVRGTISDTISATADWSKNGYSIPDAKQLAEVSQLYKNVGDGINIDEANESLISTLKGFQLEADQAEHIVDVFNEVSNNEAISSGGIGDALQRSAASFNAANTSLEKSVALVTATNSVLQDPEKVGNMWKTVSARIRGAKTELEEAGEDTDGMVESTSKLQALIKGMTGFDIMESDGKTFKDIYDIIIGIGEKWQDLNDIDRASLLEKLAGKNQSNALAAALSQVDLLKKAYGEATNAEGSAREENEEYAKSIQASIDLAKAKLEELANDLLSSDFLKGAIDAGGKLIDVLDGIVNHVGILRTAFIGLSGYLTAKNANKLGYASI